MDAIQNLRSDSLNILFLLEIFEAVLERMAAGRAVDFEDLNRLLRLLRMKCLCHEEKLERVLFPALEDVGFHRMGTDSLAMLLGHCVGRSYMRQITETLKNIRNGEKQDWDRFILDSQDYLDFLRRRIAQYHSDVIPFADSIFSRDTLRRISSNLEDIDRRVLENTGNIPFKWMAAELARVYLGNGTAKSGIKTSVLPEEKDRDSVPSHYTFSTFLNTAETQA